jgi:hypothetical protein
MLSPYVLEESESRNPKKKLHLYSQPLYIGDKTMYFTWSHMWETRNAYRDLVKKWIQRGENLNDLDVDGSVIIKWILKKLGGMILTECIFLETMLLCVLVW